MNLKTVFSNEGRIRLVSQLFQISVALWFLRMVLPGVIYVFAPSLVLLFVASAFSIQSGLFKKAYIFEFLKTFNPLLILGVFYVIGIILSDSLYERVLRDLAEFVVNLFFLIIFFALTYYSRHEEGFFWVFKRMSRVIWVSALFVALIGLAKFLLQIIGYQIFDSTPWGTSINDDNNFFALYSFLGLVGLYPRVMKSDTWKKRLLSIPVILLLLLNIIFSFSPRSLLLLLILTLGLIILQILVFVSKKRGGIYHFANNFIPLSAILLAYFAFLFFQVKTNGRIGKELSVNYFGPEKAKEILETRNPISAFQFHKWEFAVDYYQQKPLLMKVFGGGFDYLPVYGKHFNNDAATIDYPHNPVLSGLLYSGIAGAVFILYFLFVSFYYSLLYFRKHSLFSMMLLVCSLFVFFSGNSLFSVPVFLFLFSLSFMVRHQEISELELVPNLSRPGAKFIKEIFDYMLAGLALIVLSPLLLVVSVMVGFTMGWPVVFTQTRIGQNGKPFRLHKFRSMKKKKQLSTSVAAAEQMRLTRLGKIMRKYKLDELPELWNIIRGDMSFVGPRPDVPGYADQLEGEDRIILQLKPGLTGAASLKYMHEEDILSKQENPQKYNDEVIFPDKVLVNKKYMQKWTLWLDIKIIALTFLGKSSHEDKFL